MYNPASYNDRVNLASAIELKLISCGFTEEDSKGERVYSRPVKDTGMYVKVYTSIVDEQVRKEGKDAIRISGVYIKGDTRRGIHSDKRVNRIGTVPAIVGRMYQRMRDAWSACSNAERCRCGAPKFKSRKGNLVCAEICWDKNKG